MLEIDCVIYLAQAAPPTAAPPAGATPPAGGGGGGGGSGLLILFLPLFLIMILMTIFSGRKQKKQREQLLSSLNKHDRVQTVGGMIGSIVEIGDGEVVLKVEDNTKIRFSKTAIQHVIRSRTGGGSGEPAEVKPELGSAAH